VDTDAVFKALADPHRRKLLDRLFEKNGQSLSELCVGLDMTRQAVSKHLGILERANLVVALKSGRDKLHYLNPVPINEISERWIGKYERLRLRALQDLKRHLEGKGGITMTRFIYVIYIGTTAEKLWDALTQPEFTRAYWCDTWHDTTWEPGSSWKLMIPDGRVADGGEVVEIEKPQRLVLRWRNEFLPDLREEGYSRCVFELQPQADMVKLTVTHEIDKPESKFIASVSNGWPMILSRLKSLLETGEALEATKHWPKGM